MSLDRICTDIYRPILHANPIVLYGRSVQNPLIYPGANTVYSGRTNSHDNLGALIETNSSAPTAHDDTETGHDRLQDPKAREMAVVVRGRTCSVDDAQRKGLLGCADEQ